MMKATNFRNSIHRITNILVCKLQLDSLGNVINMKTHQIMQLRMVVFDANKSRLTAKKELDEVGKDFDRLSPARSAHCSEQLGK